MQQFRILHIVSSLNKGSGIMGVIMNYYRNIDRKKVQFDFLCFTPMQCTYETEIKGLGGEIYYLSKPSVKSFFSDYREYDRFFCENSKKYKAVHLHLAFLHSFILPLAKKYGIRHHIVHSHNTKYSEKLIGSIRNYILCQGLKKQANHYFACSKKAGEFLYGKKDVKSGKVRVINNAVDCDKYKYDKIFREEVRTELGINDKVVIGHVGRFAEQKNHTFLIDIFSEIKKRESRSILMLAGDGPLFNQMKDKAERLGLTKDILFLGVRNDVYRLLQAMDVFVMPSLFEGLPVIGVEAQASGLKCFMSDTVTKETAIIDVVFLDLKCSAGFWAEKILENSGDLTHRNTFLNMREAGFDIKEEARKLERFYLEMGTNVKK